MLRLMLPCKVDHKRLLPLIRELTPLVQHLAKLLRLRQLTLVLIGKNNQTEAPTGCLDVLSEDPLFSPRSCILLTEMGSRVDYVMSTGFKHRIVTPFTAPDIVRSLWFHLRYVLCKAREKKKAI